MRNRKINFRIEESGCHICISHKTDKFGYPRILISGVNTPMHRYIFDKANGPIPKGLVVRHSCDTPACINIDHLSLGTILDNIRDRHSRGRTSRKSRSVGVDNPQSKLTPEQVISIFKNGKNYTQNELAKRFGISQTSISAILSGKTWSHITSNLGGVS